jgi:hypothetical protein
LDGYSGVGALGKVALLIFCGADDRSLSSATWRRTKARQTTQNDGLPHAAKRKLRDDYGAIALRHLAHGDSRDFPPLQDIDRRY